MKYIVTGGAGFIGSNLVDKLLELNHEVIVLDNFETGSLDNLPPQDKLDVVSVDISDWNKLIGKLNQLKHADGVFHLAAVSRIPPSILNPKRTQEVNVQGTFNILEIMRLLDIKKIVFSSSSSVYGLNNPCPQTEDMRTDCLNPYSMSKKIGEELCKTWSNLYGIESVMLRYFNVYGPRAPTYGPYAPVVGLFFKQMIAGDPLTIVGDGNQTRDMIHVNDVVEANILAMIHTARANKKAVNIGRGKSYSVNKMATMIKNLPRFLVPTVNLSPRPGEAKDTLANITIASNLLGWTAQINLEDELKNLYAYYVKQGTNND